MDPFNNTFFHDIAGLLVGGDDRPAFQFRETEKVYFIGLDVPGFRSESINVTFAEGVLKVKAVQEYKAFTRSFHLPEDANVDAVSAKIEFDVLILSIPKFPKPEPRTIKVEAGPSQES